MDCTICHKPIKEASFGEDGTQLSEGELFVPLQRTSLTAMRGSGIDMYRCACSGLITEVLGTSPESVGPCPKCGADLEHNINSTQYTNTHTEEGIHLACLTGQVR